MSRAGPGRLGGRALQGLTWMMAQTVLVRVVSFLSQIALAALLAPTDFGLIGLAYTVTNFVAVLVGFGVDDVLLQRGRKLFLWMGTAFWLSFGIATLTALLVVALSPLAVMAYKAPQLLGLLAVVAVGMPLGALSSVPTVILRSRLQFRLMTVCSSVEMLAQTALTLFFAWRGFGAYSFVLPAPITACVRIPVMWWLAKTPPTFSFQTRRWRLLFGRSLSTSLSHMLIGLMSQGDYFVLGLVASKPAVGGYYFAFRLAAQPVWILAGNISGVISPLLISLRGQIDRQRDMALKASTGLSFIVTPISVLLAAAADPLIKALFAEHWRPAIPLVQLLSIGLGLDAVSWIAGSLLVARGEFKRALKFTAVLTVFFFAFVITGALVGEAVGVAAAVCIYYALSQPVFVYRVYSRVGITARQVARIYLLPLFNAAVGAGLGVLASHLPPIQGLELARAAVVVLVGFGVYAGLTRITAPDVWFEFRRHAHSVLKARLFGTIP